MRRTGFRKTYVEDRMAYSTDVQKAKTLAERSHEGAVDKAGRPYIEHPMRVAARLSRPEEQVVGWLHDVVEDTDVTIGEIRAMFGAETAAAVDAVTHREDESWADYLCRVKANPVARSVKISDLIDNSNLSRIPQVRPKDVKRQAKSNRALFFLMDVDD